MPATVLADRMGCLKAGVVANVVVPTPDYVRFATHYGFRPDFCEAADPESKGMVENLVGYAKRDLMVPQQPFDDLDGGQRRRSGVVRRGQRRPAFRDLRGPADRLATERPLLRPLPSLRPEIGSKPTTRKVDKLSCIRFGSARYSVPCRLIGSQVTITTTATMIMVVEPVTGEVLAEHALVAPGETSIVDAHYDRPRPDRPRGRRGPEPKQRKTSARLGPVAEAFLVGAAAAGVAKLGGELADILALGRPRRTDALLAALERAVDLRRWRAADIRSILATGGARPDPPAGRADPCEVLTLPSGADPVLGRLQDQSAAERPVTAAPPALAADLNDGLKRLKMAAMRRLAPELLVTAKTQRWNPEEFLRTLVEAEIAARDASNARTRRRQAGFPVTKTLDEFDLTVSSIPRATFDYLASLEWIRAAENVCLIGPAGTGKSTCCSPSAPPPSTPGTGSATSPPPTSSTPSTADSPTTASARSSTPCSATT